MGKGSGQWTLRGRVSYKGNYQNHGNEGGQFLEVLDDQGKILVRFYPAQIAWPADQRVYANDVSLLSVDHDKLSRLMHPWQPLEISAEAGELSLRYADLKPVKLKPFDEKSDWRRPKTLRLYFWCAGAGYQRHLGIEELSFSTR